MIKKIFKTIDRKEHWFWLAITVLIIVITTLPYIYAYHITPEDHIYTGLHSLTPGDIHVYYSYMEQARAGHIFFEDMYTSEAQPRVMLNSFWLLEGLVGKFTGFSNTLVFQLSRIALIPIFTFLLYLVSAAIWQNKKWRKVLFIFFCFASGWGAFGSFFYNNNVYNQHWYNWPLDLWSPEGNNLLIMFQSPHLLASTSLIISSLFFAYLSLSKNKMSYAIYSGLSALALFQFHPFHIPTILGVVSVFTLVKLIQLIAKNTDGKKVISRAIDLAYLFIVIIGISFPSIFYYLLLSEYDFGTQVRSYQNICLSPSLDVTIVSYGLLFIFALIAIVVIAKRKQWSNLNIFLTIWVVLQFALLFSPFRFQRRMMQGLQIPMVILAVQGIYYLFHYLRNKISPRLFELYINNALLLFVLFVIFFTPSNLFNWARETQIIFEVEPKFYLHKDLVSSYKWIKDNTIEGDVILSDFYSGNLIPGRAGRRVYVGHAVETFFFESKLFNMMWFYATNNQDKKKTEFLDKNSIDYILDSPQSRELGNFKPTEKDYLQKVFERGNIKIFKVVISK